MNDIITANFLRQSPLPTLDSDGDKDQRGRVLVIAGSTSVPGAALLAATAALRAGAGKLQIATCQSIATQLGLSLPEALVIALPETTAGDIAPSAARLLFDRMARCDAVLIGPGLMDADAAAELTVGLLECVPGPAFVIDAMPLVGLSRCRQVLARHNERTVLTPHAGEMAGMLGIERTAVTADAVSVARDAAALFQCVVALKGACTRVADSSGAGWTYSEGKVGLATSGSGDTLAGIVAGLLARGATSLQAAQWGVYIHGEAGNRLARTGGPVGFLARELLAEIPPILARLSEPEA
jgi:ADP-dependent NAD(P)H-hydrate dehydratase